MNLWEKSCIYVYLATPLNFNSSYLNNQDTTLPPNKLEDLIPNLHGPRCLLAIAE